MKVIVLSVLSAVLLVACHKKEPRAVYRNVGPVVIHEPGDCDSSFKAESPVKVGETGIVLPEGSNICITKGKLEVQIELPEGFAFSSAGRMATDGAGLPFATYGCYCSGVGSACNVFYAEGMGFGCLQSSCVGACTGKFTYKGYSVDKISYQADKESFFSMPSIQYSIAALTAGQSFSKHELYGVPFYLVKDEKAFLAKASCDCEGTTACKLKVLSLQQAKGVVTDTKIYYCEGGCNGCELSVK